MRGTILCAVLAIILFKICENEILIDGGNSKVFKEKLLNAEIRNTKKASVKQINKSLKAFKKVQNKSKGSKALDESKTCKDNYGRCWEVAFKDLCWDKNGDGIPYTEICKRACGMCDGMSPHRSVKKCHDKSDQCEEFADKYCYQAKIADACCHSCGLGEGMTPVASVECFDASDECASILDNGCYRNKDICKKTCGLCKGMEAASSYTCYDENPSQCPQVAKQKGGCYRNKDKCKKSCGHCKGLTPVASNSNCYDIADGCEKVVANHCHIHRNQEVCKKSCGLCGNQTAALSNTCYDESSKCPKLAETNCHGHGKYCKKSCGLCEGVEGMKPHDTNKCWDVYPNCADVAKKYCYQPQIARDCCISCGLGEGMTPVESYTCYDKASNCGAAHLNCALPTHSIQCEKTCNKCRIKDLEEAIAFEDLEDAMAEEEITDLGPALKKH